MSSMADSEATPHSSQEDIQDDVDFHIPSLPKPIEPLTKSYTYHSPIPSAEGPYILGVDEAGRGPVLGPMVYGVAYCPEAYKNSLNEMGFADSKALKHTTRQSLLADLSSDPQNLGWSVRILSPQTISNGMLRRPAINLNQQAQEATVLLIREVLERGVQISEAYVDALGATDKYEAYLSSLFPSIQFTVTAKADSIFKIVGAASVAAKVTRDAWISGWVYEEVASSLPSSWPRETGSGYPSDPKTQSWLKSAIEPTFGYPSLVRFSWATVKVALDKDGHAVKWTDDGQASLIKAFEGAKGLDKGRCVLAKELHLKSVCTL